MRVDDIVTGASQKPVEPEEATRIEERDIMLHHADVPGTQNIRELSVGGEHIYLPAQLLCHPSQLENNDRAAAELRIANDVKQLHIHPRGMDQSSDAAGAGYRCEAIPVSCERPASRTKSNE